MGRHHLAGGRNSLRRLQNERLHSPPQTLRLQRNLTPAFVEAADRGGLFFSSLLFSSQRTLRLSVLSVKFFFYFPISFFYSIPYFFSSIATRNPNPHDSRILNSGCNFLTTGLLPSPVILRIKSSAASIPSWCFGNSTVVNRGRKIPSHG